MNQISDISAPLSATIRSLTLEHNEFTALEAIKLLSQLPNLERLSLRGNRIKNVRSLGETSDKIALFRFSQTLTFLDLSYNAINSWKVVNALPDIFPGLTSLRITSNPLFDQAVAPASVTKNWLMPKIPAFGQSRNGPIGRN